MVDRARCVLGRGLLAIALVTPPIGFLLAHCSSTDKPNGADTSSVLDAATPRADAGARDSGSRLDASGSQCDGGQMLCSAMCTDLNNDPSNCGRCGNQCGMGMSCIAGQCNCLADAGQSMCNSACVALATDPSNCGACGHACQGSMCAGGLCQPTIVAQAGMNVADIAVDQTDMYWTQGGPMGPPSINRKAFAGGAAQGIVSSEPNLADPRGVAVDEIYVYWVDYASGAVQRWQKVGAMLGTIVAPPPVVGPLPDGAPPADAGPSPPLHAIDIAVDHNNVYWVTYDGQVLSAPIGGGSWTVLATGEDHPVAIAVDDTNVYWANEGGNQQGTGSIKQAPKSPGAGGITVLAMNENTPWDIAVDQTSVYWTTKVNPGEVRKAPIGGNGAAVTLTPPSQRLGAPYGIAVDPPDAGPSRYVYWTNYDDNTVMRLPIDADGGQQPFVLASQQNNPAAIAVKDNNVYWVNSGLGTILKVAK